METTMEPVPGETSGRSIRIRLRPAGPAVVVRLDGPLTVEADLMPLVELTAWAGSRRRLLVLDLAGVGGLDCTGLGRLASLVGALDRTGGRAACAHVERRQEMLMHRAGLTSVTPIFGDTVEALNWLGEAAMFGSQAPDVPPRQTGARREHDSRGC